MLRRFFGGLLLFSLAAACAAGGQRYVASEHQSTWQVASSRLYCSLSHDIPIYGKAIFERTAGGELDFRLQVKRKPRSVGVARLVSNVPAWDHDSRARDLGQVNFKVDRAPFQFKELLARRLLLELERGLFPTFSYQDWSDGRDEVEVALSAVNVRRSLGEFLDCLENQLPHSFDYVRESRIAFGFDSSDLSGQAKMRLDEVVEYMLADPAVGTVTLEGRTDSVGFRRYNEALARRRSEAVRNYLIEKGIDPGRLQISARLYGERNPVASNRTPQGRALNRTVMVRLAK